MTNERVIVGVLAVIIGAAAALWRLPLARFMIDRQNALWGFRFGARTIALGSFVLLALALALAAYGMALLAGLL